MITLGVQMQAKKAKQAFSSSKSRMTSVVNAVKRQGVPASQIQTTSMSLWFDNQRNVSTVSHSVTIRLDRVDKLGAVLDAAVTAGANNSWGVSFGVKDPSAAQARALQAAIADAKAHANSIAKALGLSITQATSVDETSYGYSAVATAKGMGGGGGAIQPGESEVSADVVVTYSAG